MTDRVCGISENVMQSMGQVIMNCVNNEPNFFQNLQCWRLVADKLLSAMEHQVVTNQGADLAAIRTLYRFFHKAIVASDPFFDKFVDRREFFNNLVLIPLIKTGRTLKSMTVDNQVDVLKRARTLFSILLTWVSKTALVRNGHVFTLNILDNEDLVHMVQQFQEFEVE